MERVKRIDNKGTILPLWADGIILSTIFPMLNWVSTQIIGYKMVSSELVTCTAIGGGIVTLYSVMDYSGRMTRDFRTILNNDNIKILKKEKKDYGYDLTFNLPVGMSIDDFDKKTIAIEQYLNAKIQSLYFNNRIKLIVENNNRDNTYDIEVIFDDVKNKKHEFFIGVSNGKKVYWDFKEYPHALVGGGTGAGKTTFLLSLISMMHKFRKQNTIDIYLADFKGADLSLFERSKYVQKYCKTKPEFVDMLIELNAISQKRYAMFNKTGVRDIYKYNDKNKKKLSDIFVIVDEIAVLEGERQIHQELQSRVALDRAAGIHYILSTQSPRHQVIPGLLKCNLPCRLAFKTFNERDSEVLFDERGAERLRGKGEGLFKTNKIERVQCAYVSEDWVEEFMKGFNKPQEEIIDNVVPFKPVKKGVVEIGNQ